MRKITSYKVISLFIKLAIVITALAFIYNKLFHSEQIGKLSSSIQTPSLVSASLVFVLLLMLLNWGLEALKWQGLICKLEPISFLQSVKAILSGITVSVFTPNRIGEFGGRIFYLEKADRIQAILINMIGSLAQLIVTVIVGMLGALCLIQNSKYNVMPSTSINCMLVSASLIIAILLLLAYLRLPVFAKWFDKTKYLKRISQYTFVVSLYSKSELLRVLFLSLLRYVIFSSQFYLLLHVFGVTLSMADAMVTIAVTFLAITVIPTLAFTELGVRGSVALLFIGPLSDNSTGIISASLALWLVNIALPALAGTPFVFKFRFLKSEQA